MTGVSGMASREVAKSLLPDPVVRSVQAVLIRRAYRRSVRTKPIDLSRLELIREASIEQLSDPTYIEQDLLPRLGLNDETGHFPSSLQPFIGEGLLCWQYPNQFSKYLVHLSRQGIESYLEIGIRHGGTFVITIEYLSRFNPIREAAGVDLGHSPTLQEYAASRPGVTVIQASSHDDGFKEFVRGHEPFDLILIDGDHSREGCQEDFELVRDHGRVLVLHDIVSQPVPGVAAVWQEVRRLHEESFEFIEFTDQYPSFIRERGGEFLGIGVAQRRNEGRASERAHV